MGAAAVAATSQAQEKGKKKDIPCSKNPRGVRDGEIVTSRVTGHLEVQHRHEGGDEKARAVEPWSPSVRHGQVQTRYGEIGDEAVADQ